MKLRSFGRRRSRALFGCLIGLLAIGGFAAATATPATSRTATTTTTSTAGPSSVLPGGTSLSIGITTPADGATVPAAPLTVQGTAEIGQAAPLPNTALIYVVDVSGSTQTLGTSTTCGNQNVYDTRAETTLDCELRAIKELNAAAIAAGTVGQIGMIAFGGASGAGQLTDAVQLDLNQSSGIQLFVSPAQHDASAFFGGTSDLEVVLKSAYVDPYVSAAAGWPAPGIDNGFTMFTTKNVYGNTNFWAAVKSVRDLATHTTLPNKLVAFISDGASTRGSPSNLGVSDALTGITGIKIDTFAVGPDATCTGGSYGSLRDISNATGGTCTLLTDPADAADVVPGVIASHLNAINLRVDGAPALAATTSPVLPASGPATVSWSRTISGLAPGSHQLCGEAFASDGGGGGSAVDCIDVIVKAPPTITLSGGDDPVTGVAGEVPEGSSFAVGASVSDGATTWSSSGGTGDCAFADPSALSTSVTCDDDGLYALTLTADDGVNPPVSATEHLLVDNVAPSVGSSAPPAPTPLGGPVTIAWPFGDPGTNDTFTCAIDWGDGIIGVGTIAGGACQGTHTYTSAGAFNAIATVTDDDGGAGSAGVSLVVDSPPTIEFGAGGGGGVAGDEGTPVVIAALVGDDLTTPALSWTVAPGAGVDAGATCAFAEPHAAITTVSCTDDGEWTLTLTADDGVNPPVAASEPLTLANVAPTLSLAGGAAGLTVTVTGTVGDAGSNDTHDCTFDWNDGVTTTVVGTCTAAHTYAPGPASRTIDVTATDDDGGAATASVTVLVNRAPSCTGATVSPNPLWPADHRYVLVTVGGCTDADGDAITVHIDSVTQDEALNGAGDGDTSPDARHESGNGRVSLRAERRGSGDGRVYTIAFTASDGLGGSTSHTVTVGVPRNAGGTAVKTPGVSVNSFG